MKYGVMCLCLVIVLNTHSITGMMTRIRVEKKLEELKEENNQLNQKVETCILYKKAILLGSFLSSLALGVKLKSYKATFVPPLLGFPALLYAQHTINEARAQQEFISLPIRNLEKAITKYDNPGA